MPPALRYAAGTNRAPGQDLPEKTPLLRFILPSSLGVAIFLVPVAWDGELTIGIGIITQWVKALMGAYGVETVVVLMVLTSVMTFLASVLKVRLVRDSDWFGSLFDVPLSWFLVRLAGTVFGLMYLYQAGPALLLSEEVGGAVYKDIAVNVVAVYISACLLLPLLTEFGFMEFVGTLARPFFRRVFRLPGRAAIDATASFVGASSIGLLITIGQYERKFYTAREASVIAANFSVVSIPFSLVVANVSGIGQLFVPWYAFVVLTCIAAAVITPRLPPLSRKANEYIDGSLPAGRAAEEPGSLLAEAWHKAIERARTSPGVFDYFAMGARNLMFFLFSVVAAAMAFATIAALLTFHTPAFEWLGYPFVAILELAGLPEAANAAPGLFAGFLDQYMPAVVASSINAERTSFVLAGLSVCQLVFMSEVGVIILRSRLPLGFRDLVSVFLLRTLIAVPILVAGANLVVDI